MDELMIKIDNVKKQYRLGAIGGGTLQGDIQSWWARIRGKEDPNSKIGAKVYKKNEKFMALNGVSFEVKKGERVGIIGHNGAGKSTLLKLLSRVTAPTEGQIYLNGRIASMLEVGTGFHGELTGRENIYMNGAILGMTKTEIDSKIDDIIEFSECGQFIDTPVKRYSSGMYVKLAFAVAAHLDSEILVMDEVLAVGDMKFQQKCLGKMSDVSQSEGRTVLYVSHNMNTIRQLCDRCVVLDHGQVVFNGGVEEAIEIYLERSNNKCSTYVNFDEIERNKPELGVKARLKAFEFTNKDTPVFTNGEKIRFRLKWEKNDTETTYRMMLPIKCADGTSVGGSFSCVLDNLDAVYEWDVSCLVEGRYNFVIALFAVNSFGTATICDHSIIRLSFDIVNDDSKMEWKKQWWGNVRFPEICEINK